MCTLSYIPAEKNTIITFSRDERANRKCILPKEHSLFNQKIYFSKDVEKGGTWLALQNKTMVCLLNGADQEVDPDFSYTESRGKIVLERFDFQNNTTFFNALQLENYAPFTLVIFDFNTQKSIEQITWNGNEKFRTKIPINTAKIWSSSTLYSNDVKREREQWFLDFLAKKTVKNPSEVLDFHLKKHTENLEHNILMKRKDGKQTTSISQIEINENEVNYHFLNFIDHLEQKKQWKEMDLQLL